MAEEERARLEGEPIERGEGQRIGHEGGGDRRREVGAEPHPGDDRQRDLRHRREQPEEQPDGQAHRDAPPVGVPEPRMGQARAEPAEPAMALDLLASREIAGNPAGHAHRADSQRAKSRSRSSKPLNSSALPKGSRKNIVPCSPAWPSKRIWGSMRNSTSAARRSSASMRQSAIDRTTPKCGTGTESPSTGLRPATGVPPSTRWATIWWPYRLKSTQSVSLRPSGQPRMPP